MFSKYPAWVNKPRFLIILCKFMHAGNHPPWQITVKAKKFRGLNFFRNASLKFQKSEVLTTASLNGEKQTRTYPMRPTEELEPKERNPVNHQRRYWQVNCEKKDCRFYDCLWPKVQPLYRELPQAGKQEWAFRYKTLPGELELGYSLCSTWICRPGNTRRKIAQI